MPSGSTRTVTEAVTEVSSHDLLPAGVDLGMRQLPLAIGANDGKNIGHEIAILC